MTGVVTALIPEQRAIPEFWLSPCYLKRAVARMQDLIMTASPGFPPLAGGGWLVDESVFRFLVDLEIHKAQRLRYSVSFVCITVESAATENGERSPVSTAEAIARYLRSTDAVALWRQGWLAVLLVDAEPPHLPSIVERLTSRGEAGSWSAGGSSYPRTAARAEDMLRQAEELMAQARSEGGNRLYVAS